MHGASFWTMWGLVELGALQRDGWGGRRGNNVTDPISESVADPYQLFSRGLTGLNPWRL